jgi:hypothetical protein
MASKSVTTRKAPTPVPSFSTKAAPAAKKPAAKKLAPKKRPAAPTQKKPVVKAPAKKAKHANKKQKTIRDSFNMPADDYALIGALKVRAVASGREAKKSELLRAGLQVLASMSDVEFAKAIGAVAAIKTGRPVKKHK